MSGPWGSGKTTLLNIIGGKNLGVKDEDFGKFPLSQSWLCLPTLQSRFNPILEIAGWL
ncbi:MAG: ATP-binding cassette domain-containing protein, partial [Candidatus Bathycorpusculaceae bacterium]